jgi:hypothetical protein
LGLTLRLGILRSTFVHHRCITQNHVTCQAVNGRIRLWISPHRIPVGNGICGADFGGAEKAGFAESRLTERRVPVSGDECRSASESRRCEVD